MIVERGVCTDRSAPRDKGRPDPVPYRYGHGSAWAIRRMLAVNEAAGIEWPEDEPDYAWDLPHVAMVSRETYGITV